MERCATCGEPVAVAAKVCPHCGAPGPRRARTGLGQLAVFAGQALLVIGAVVLVVVLLSL